MPILNKQVNYDILGTFTQSIKGTDFETNIPELTRENIATVGNAIMDYQPTRDMFYNSFMVKIALQLFKSFSADNKFKWLKGQQISDGDIEDAYVDYIKGEVFNGADENPFKVSKATIKTLYHKKDRELTYATTISDTQLRNAFKSESGLSTLINMVINTLYESKEFDEYTMFKQLLVDNFKNAGKVITLTGATKPELLENFLYQLKKTSNKLTYLSRDYNKLEVLNKTSKENQLIVVLQDYIDDIDMGILANTLNMDKLKIENQVYAVDNFNSGIINGDETATVNQIVAGIFDSRGFRIHDALVHMETQRNAKSLYTNYFLHAWSIVSFAYFFNSVYFLEPTQPLSGEGE